MKTIRIFITRNVYDICLSFNVNPFDYADGYPAYYAGGSDLTHIAVIPCNDELYNKLSCLPECL